MRDDPPHPAAPADKILPLDRVVEVCQELRARGRTIAQCHGCFDLVHPGHIRHLKEAAEQADCLLVSITTDESVGKGDGRPLFPEHLRAENLAALSFVDLVCVNTEPTAVSLLERVRPDVFVKGREYENNDDPRFARERETVERCGGRVVFTSGDLVFSSTALIRSVADGRAAEVAESEHDAAIRRLRLTHAVEPDDYAEVLDRIRGSSLLVVGESITDTYVSCDQPEVASESPCLSLRPLERASFDGGAAVIALHAAAMGARPTLVTALPRDETGQARIERLEKAGVVVRTIRTDAPVLEKQRFLVGDQKVVKIDLVKPLTLDTDARAELLGLVRDAVADGVDAAIVADFGNGLLTPRTLEDITSAVRPRARVLAGDVSGRRASLAAFHEMDLVTPTEQELRRSVQDYESSLNAVVWNHMERTGADSVITTLADEGLIVFTRLADAVGDEWRARVAGEHIPSLDPRPLDPLGCGDALLAAATLALASGASHVQAAYLGAAAAAVESSRLGNHPVRTEQVLDLMRRLASPTLRVETRAPRSAPGVPNYVT